MGGHMHILQAKNSLKVAVVGAGLAGLGAAFHLAQGGAKVTVFDAQGIGSGASGVCSGLLHPYPGLSARRSQFASEALAASHALIELAEKQAGRELCLRGGILRKAVNPEQLDRLTSYEDVTPLGEELFLIESGMTVYCKEYLEALGSLLQDSGVLLVQQQVEGPLEGFDRTLLACGYGVREFAELPVEFLKGQLLCYEGEGPYPKSFISKGYIAKSRAGFEVGSTYERRFTSDLPCLETAQKLLPAQQGVFLGVKAAVRVCPKGSYLPIVERLQDGRFVFTGLGSRGLLYHAFFGKKVAQMILNS